MLLAGLVTLAMCVRAARRSDRAAARRALRWSAVPPALGVVGVLFGVVVLALNGQIEKAWGSGAPYLSCTVLFGLFVADVPALWTLMVYRRGPTALS
ncbi:MAG: hypothetical protein FJ304_04815 [Planctomycetes bacterium]|nr:hypothetical protein [Planctomycetota bacterium]